MSRKIDKLWKEATETGEKVLLSNEVICDICNADLTGSDDSGGFVFGSYSYCPACAKDGLASIAKYGEERYIKARCPKGVSFADFIRDYRGPDSFIRIQTFK